MQKLPRPYGPVSARRTRPASAFRAPVALLVASLALIGVTSAHAEVASGRTITLVVASGTNTTIDTLARLIAPSMSQTLGQPVVVENRPGGNGLVAGTLVAKATPDGATLLLDTSAIAVPPGPSRSASYDPAKAFKTLGVLALFPYVFVTFPPYAAASVPDVVRLAKRSPDEVAFASTGTGSAQHLAAALFEDLAGIDLLNIPYRNSGLALSDVASRQVPLLFADYASVQTHLKDARLRPLAVTGRERLALLPDVPTMRQAGVAGYEVYEWNPVLAPTGVTPEVAGQLAAAVRKATETPAFKSKVQALGGEPFGTLDPQDFLLSQRRLWTKVIGDRRIKLD